MPSPTNDPTVTPGSAAETEAAIIARAKTGDPDAILEQAREEEKGRGARAQAETFLRELLGASEVPVTEIRTAAAAHGLGWRTVQRAQQTLGIRARRKSRGEDGGGHWTWQLKEFC